MNVLGEKLILKPVLHMHEHQICGMRYSWREKRANLSESIWDYHSRDISRNRFFVCHWDYENVLAQDVCYFICILILTRF